MSSAEDKIKSHFQVFLRESQVLERAAEKSLERVSLIWAVKWQLDVMLPTHKYGATRVRGSTYQKWILHYNYNILSPMRRKQLVHDNGGGSYTSSAAGPLRQLSIHQSIEW